MFRVPHLVFNKIGSKLVNEIALCKNKFENYYRNRRANLEKYERGVNLYTTGELVEKIIG